MDDKLTDCSERYEIRETIGKGASGEVVKAYDRTLKRSVAMKLIRTDWEGTDFSPGSREKNFQNEARKNANLNHKNIVHVNNHGIHKGRLFIDMELLEGLSLHDLLKEAHISVDQAVEIAIQVLKALEHAHKFQVIHRDIKPENIFVCKDSTIKTLDFGISIAVGEKQHIVDINGERRVIGTAQYMSPEQAMDHEVDARSDIYSFGVVFYQMLSGGLPFNGTTNGELMRQHVSAFPNALPDKIPRKLREIVTRAMQKNPVDRYPSVHEMLVELESFEKNSKLPLLYKKQIAILVAVAVFVAILISTLSVNGARPRIHQAVTDSEKQSLVESHRALEIAKEVMKADSSLEFKKQEAGKKGAKPFVEDVASELNTRISLTPEAIRLCNDAIKLDPLNEEAYYVKGLAYFYGPDNSKSFAWVADSINRFPENHELKRLSEEMKKKAP